jgi:hypothetical protein
MKLSQFVRAAVERRLGAMERHLGGIEGLLVERRGDEIRVRGKSLIRRLIDDPALRFAGLAR